MISDPPLARPDLTPPNDRRAPKLERVRVLGDAGVPWAAAALWAPSFAMTREREMRGLRATRALGLGGMTAGRGIFDGELSSAFAKSAVAAAPSEGSCAGDAFEAGLPKFVRGWLKILLGGGDIEGMRLPAGILDGPGMADARFWFSGSVERPEGRPDVDGFTAEFVFARELAVGAKSDDVLLRAVCSFPSPVVLEPMSALELVEARVLVLAMLLRVPIEDTAVEDAPVIALERVPIEETALVRED